MLVERAMIDHLNSYPMKTILSSLFFFLAVTTASASINPIDLIVQTDPTSHTLTLRTAMGVDLATKVQLKDANGLVLHTSKLDSGEYLNGRFVLSKLPAGTYYVEVTDVQGKTVQPFTIDGVGITADPALATRSFYPG